MLRNLFPRTSAVASTRPNTSRGTLSIGAFTCHAVRSFWAETSESNVVFTGPRSVLKRSSGSASVPEVKRDAKPNHGRQWNTSEVHKMTPTAISESTHLSPVALASKMGWLEIVRSFIDGAESKAALHEVVNEFTETHSAPLYYACQYNRPKVAALLVANGADVNFRGHSGKTPLHWAAEVGAVECCEILLTAGCDVATMSVKTGRSPLHAACSKLQVDVVRLILKHRPSDSRDVQCLAKWSPSHVAASRGSVEIAQLLIDHGDRHEAAQVAGEFAHFILGPDPILGGGFR